MSAATSENVRGNNQDDNPTENIGLFKRIINSITIEPFVICWLLPFVFSDAAIKNLNLEKVCREYAVDQGIDKEVCKLFIQKSNFKLNCMGNNSTFIDWNKISNELPEIHKLTTGMEENVVKFLCDGEKYVQTRINHIDSIRNSLSAIGPLVVLWFAGPWSDRKKLRLPCMLVPYLGEAIGYVILFISAVYVDCPVELPAYGYRFIPAFTGAENLMMMAAFSYLTAITTEENRTFRFGVYSVIFSIMPFIGNLAAPTLIKYFTYAQLFGMMIPVHILGLVYFLRLKEPERKVVENGNDNLGMDDQHQTQVSMQRLEIASMEAIDRVETEPKNFCLEFFDPTYAIQCITVVMKKRENVLKSLLIFLLVSYFLSYSAAVGEDNVLPNSQRIMLNWDVVENAYNNSYRIFCGTIGIIIMTGVVGKLLKVPDIFLALISIVLSIISKFVYYTSDTTLKFFIGSTIDATGGVRNVATRSILSRVISADETATTFSFMGVLEAVGQFIFNFVYPKVYQYLLEIENVKMIFMFSIALLIPVLILLCAIYKLLKIKETAEKRDESTNL